jgi:hypothetical protein
MPGWLWFAIAIALGLVIYLLLRGRRVGARRRAPAIEYIPPDGEPLVQDQAEDQVEPVLPTTLASQPGGDGDAPETDAGETEAELQEDAELRHDEGYVETLPAGAGPHGWTVKGNADSMLFYTADAPGYLRATADVWFESEETATAAGFVRWDAHHR